MNYEQLLIVAAVAGFLCPLMLPRQYLASAQTCSSSSEDEVAGTQRLRHMETQSNWQFANNKIPGIHLAQSFGGDNLFKTLEGYRDALAIMMNNGWKYTRERLYECFWVACSIIILIVLVGLIIVPWDSIKVYKTWNLGACTSFLWLSFSNILLEFNVHSVWPLDRTSASQR